MGRARIPAPALVVVGTLFSSSDSLDEARHRLTRLLGEVRLAAEPVRFAWTGYYQSEMGDGLWRCLLAGQHLARRDLLADLKLWTNRIEQELAGGGGRRTINLDPGLLSAENLVLATTKNRAHRVYLRDGIFAEASLEFVQGRFRPYPWTYPDYQTDHMFGLLASLRAEYMQRLRHGAGRIIECLDEQN